MGWCAASPLVTDIGAGGSVRGIADQPDPLRFEASGLGSSPEAEDLGVLGNLQTLTQLLVLLPVEWFIAFTHVSPSRALGPESED